MTQPHAHAHAHALRTSSWPDDEITSRICTLGSLVHGDVAVVGPSTSLDEVSLLLVELRVPAVVVVDADGGLLGLVTRTDVLRAAPRSTAADVMTTYVLALPDTAVVERAAALMAFERVGQIIVVDDDGGLLGMISAVDVARHYALEAGFVV